MKKTQAEHLSKNESTEALSKSNSVDHRRFFRISKRCKVRLQACDGNGTVNGNFTEQAFTLDYSPGGVRILLKREFPSDSLFLLDFGNDFVVPQLQGIAQPCWSKKLENRSADIEAGLAFQDPFSQAVLAAQTSY